MSYAFSVKKLKNKTLLVETNRKSQSDNLLKTKTFFGLKVSVTVHKSLNTSKGIIRDRMLKGEKEDDIVEYLKEQGVVNYYAIDLSLCYPNIYFDFD